VRNLALSLLPVQWHSRQRTTTHAVLDQFLALAASDVAAINHVLLTCRNAVAAMPTLERQVECAGELSSARQGYLNL